jgi:hypothetical protein
MALHFWHGLSWDNSMLDVRAQRDSSKPVKPAERSEELSSTMDLLQRLIKEPTIAEVLAEDTAPQTRMVYTRAVTIWMLILQRLGKGLTLSDVVSQMHEFDHHLLPDNKRVREGTLSKDDSSYNRARQRLSLETVLAFSHAVCDYLGRTSRPIYEDRRIFILDGTTFTLPPTPELRQAFPPASNQHGDSVWPIAQLAVAHELRSGCALLPQVDPMYGPNAISEVKQCLNIIERLPENSIVMADSNFGIFGVAHACRRAGHNFLLRLTAQRFRALVKKAELHSQDEQCKTYRLSWRPSSQDRRSTPDLAQGTVIECYVHEYLLPDGKRLYLVTDMPITGACAAELYCRRYDVEFDIRDVKVTLDTESIRAKSVAMMMKELMSSIVAYNLLAQFRRQAAELAKVEPRRLSFTSVWRTFRYVLLFGKATTPEQWQATYTRALLEASRWLLPNRKKPRSYPRQAHHRRPKTTKFQKSQRSKQSAKPPPLEAK